MKKSLKNPVKTNKLLDENGKFAVGNPGGPGRPKGSISIIGTIKKKFEENPEYFEQWIDKFMEDPAQRKAILEQIDGKPKQTMDIDMTFPQTLIDIIKHGTSD